MEVVIIGPSRRFLSGISYYTMRLCNALSEFFHVKAILFRRMLPKRLFPGWKRIGDDLTRQEFDSKVEVHEILDWYDPSTWLNAFKLMRDADAIIIQWWTSSVAHMYFAIEMLNFKRRSVIIEFHEVVDPFENSILPVKVYSRIMGNLVRRLSSYYVVHSSIDKEIISEIYGIDRERIWIIPHGIYDHYCKMSKQHARYVLGIDEKFVILFFGLLRPYKGVKYLVRAFEMLPAEIMRDSRLLIVGEVWEDRETKQLISESMFRDRIQVVDRYVSDDEASLYFSAADVLVIPYTRASQSGVAHIGMAFGMPIIASDVGGLRESLSKYEGTFFVQPGNADALKNALVEASRHHREYEPPEELRWDAVAERWCEMLVRLKRR